MYLTYESKKEIERIANSIIKKFSINPFNFDTIYFLKKDYGFDISYRSYKDKKIDSILLVNDEPMCSDIRKEISISHISYAYPESLPRLRHRLLHMLGHYVLHRNPSQPYGVKDYIDRTPYKDEYAELEADYFASVMLMPENAVKSIIPFCKHDLDKIQTMKHMFNVSERIARNRLYNLKLIEMN